MGVVYFVDKEKNFSFVDHAHCMKLVVQDIVNIDHKIS